MPALFQLSCGAQQYGWGKLGDSSSVARFAAATDPKFVIGDKTPYAELWMGTHPSVPSKSVVSGDLLADILSKDHSLIGEAVATKFDGFSSLPFLFKVLSIRNVLSIQAHPDKALAAQLHSADPKNYPDDNHKPEMAIALDDFEGFCGFRPAREIKTFLSTVPQFKAILSPALADRFSSSVIDTPTTDAEEQNNKALLQALFEGVMTASSTVVETEAQSLVDSVVAKSGIFSDPSIYSILGDLILRLNQQFPLDIGLFCGVFLLNYVTLTAGEAIFLKAKDPHAYISGDIIECMAASDNVVRAGFTPKFKDVKNLVAMLTYDNAPVDDQKMKPAQFGRAAGDGDVTVYNPPIPEFAVLRTAVKQDKKETINALEGPSVVVVTEGTGFVGIKGSEELLALKPGFVFFVGAGTDVEFSSSQGTVVAYTAFCEV
ncbi:mannose-6-phosphate isomerase [Lipomyces oligophaga]|uniref:mannose-6-phosphate isomerase n=1 Tax=Lipomyces oligophaga TaxID=45792 RepID=UPI0034CF12A8